MFCEPSPQGHAGSRQHLDLTSQAWRPRQPNVASDENDVHELGQGDIGGVVHRQVLPELPTSVQQPPVRDPSKGQFDQVRQGQLGSSGGEIPEEQLSSEDGCDLEVDQRGRDESLASQARASGITVRGVVSERGRQDTCINDDHGPPPLSRRRPRTTLARQPCHRRARAPRRQLAHLPPRSGACGGTPEATDARLLRAAARQRGCTRERP